MKFSIVNYSEIKDGSDFRFDAEYYHPDCLDIHKKIKSKEHVLFFSKVKKIGSGKNLPQAENGNYKFIRTQNVRPVLISDTGMSSTNELEKLSLTKEGELLFVRVGGVGDSSVITKKYSGNAVSDNVLKLEIEGINPFYCSIFFNSKIGQTYFKRNLKGTARGLISQENFKDILIPVFSVAFQEAIQNCVEESQDLIEKSKYAYQLAQDILLAELGLDGWKPTQQLWCEKDYSDTVAVGRIDAEYYQPKYEEIINAITEYSITNYSTPPPTLGDLATIKKSIEVGSGEYLNEGIPFIRVSNINPFEITEEKYISEELYNQIITHQPKKGEILLSKDATPGIAFHLDKTPKKMIPSGGILRLKLKTDNINGEYLTLVLNSLLTKEQANRDVGGSVIMHWRPEQVSRVVIPILPKDKQLEIQGKVMESFKLRTDSKKLLENAKRAVEIAIEQDETTAIQFLNS